MRVILTRSPPGQNGHHFADNIFRCIFLNGTFRILIKISLKFVPKCPTNNNPALVAVLEIPTGHWSEVGNFGGGPGTFC